jgi:hypothetical protein
MEVFSPLRTIVIGQPKEGSFMSNGENTLTVDGRTYAVDRLSENAKAQVVNLKVVDEDIRRIEQRLAIYRTARAAYARALKSELYQRPADVTLGGSQFEAGVIQGGVEDQRHAENG